MRQKPSKPRVGIDARQFSGKSTGIGSVLLNFLLENQQRSASGGGLDLLLFGNNDTILPKGLDCELIKTGEGPRVFFDQMSLLHMSLKSGIDILFSPYPKIPVAGSMRKVISIHDLIPLKVEPMKNSFKSLVYRGFLMDAYISASDAIVTVSENSKKDIIEAFKVEEKRISVVYPCIPHGFGRTTESGISTIRQKHGIRTKGFVLYVGNSLPHKNLNALLRAYSLLPEKMRSEYGLVLAGTEEIDLPGEIRGTVKLLGYVDNADLPGLFSAASLFAFPSLYEGFGIPPLEAMACGCPVASSNASCMPEVLGDACLYFDPKNPNDIAEKIQTVIENETQRNDLIKRGLQRSMLYTRDRLYDSLRKAILGD